MVMWSGCSMSCKSANIVFLVNWVVTTYWAVSHRTRFRKPWGPHTLHGLHDGLIHTM
ncbi:hypothetical protein HanPSC8_Chr09g0369391 [Helianthus annuus]|nr:hypothetical protein HanPSC8_Chr09g0369391 [Helianthus annuus]